MKIKEAITNLAVDILFKAAVKIIESYVVPEVEKELEEMMKEKDTINTHKIMWESDSKTLVDTINKLNEMLLDYHQVSKFNSRH